MNSITLICNRNYSVKKFRFNLINDLKKHGYQVSLIIIDDSNERLSIDDVNIYYIADNNRSINPLSKIILKNRIKDILLKIKPNIVFTFQVTPNTFGVLAAKECGIDKIYSMVEGLGDVFLYNSLKWKIVRLITCNLFRIAFKKCKAVFFINNDDKEEFIRRKLVKREICKVIPGVGVDLEHFSYKPNSNTNTFVMLARMLKSKGVLEYCEAARIVKNKYPNTVFNYYGEEFELKKSDIQEYINDHSINYLGWQEDIRIALENSFMNILPSYREGFGLVIAEAGAIGRASIAYNCIGCKDAIDDNKTGILVKDNNLVNAIIYSLEHKEEMIQMGINARKKAEQMFDKNIINKEVIEAIEKTI